MVANKRDTERTAQNHADRIHFVVDLEFPNKLFGVDFYYPPRGMCTPGRCDSEPQVPTLTQMGDRIRRTAPPRAIWLLDAQQPSMNSASIPFEALDGVEKLVSHALKTSRERNSSLRSVE